MKLNIKTFYSDYGKTDFGSIELSGWVRTNRASKSFGFIELNDGTFFKSVQVVYEEAFLDNFAEVSKLTVSSAVTVRGFLELTPEGRQPFEIKAREFIIEAPSERDYPLQKKRHSMEFMREIAHLRPRSNTFSAVFRVRSLAAYAVHRFFQERGFVYIHTPVITGSDAEGAGEMFHVTSFDIGNVPKRTGASPGKSDGDTGAGPAGGRECGPENFGCVDYSRDFFGKPASLTVSGQLEAEAYALAFGKVYTFGPTFRAENSNTARHAAEFWMIEPEIAFADLHDDMQLAEDMVKYIISYVLENAPEEMAFFDSFVEKGIIEKLRKITSSDFGRITYTEAIEVLKNSGREFEYPVVWGMDLQTEHERYLAEDVFARPVFVTDYPKDIKAFYMRLNDDGKTVAAADLLAPGIGEIIGGSQREERYDVLRARMEELGMEETGYEWYLDLRRYGGAGHAGFGLGFERMVMYITGMSNIRDVIPFPRTPKSLEF